MDQPATGKQVQCVIVTPERTVVDEMVDFVALPMYDGELGVLPGRAPLIGRLGPGELRTRKGNTIHRYFVDGGFAQVRANTVTVLTPRAKKAEEINPKEVEQALAVKGPTTTPDARLKAQQRARIQLRIARKVSEEEAAAH